MMKTTLISVCLMFFLLINTVSAQNNDFEYGRVLLTSHINNAGDLPRESAATLIRKLEQIISKSGAIASPIDADFVLSAEISVGTKDILPGPPQMIAQNLELTLRVGDAASGIAFAMVTTTLRGVGTNENKSILEAIKTISPKNKSIRECVENGKEAIIQYYTDNCSALIEEASSKAQLGQHDEAIFMLSRIPGACPDCYARALDACHMIYQAKVNTEGAQYLQTAKSYWSADPTQTGAAKAAEFLKKVSPYSTSFNEAQELSKVMRTKFEEEQQAEWAFKLQQYEDQMSLKRESQRIAEENAKRDDLNREEQQKRQYELEQLRIVEYSAVAKVYARNQPKTVAYNYINWR